MLEDQEMNPSATKSRLFRIPCRQLTGTDQRRPPAPTPPLIITETDPVFLNRCIPSTISPLRASV